MDFHITRTQAQKDLGQPDYDKLVSDITTLEEGTVIAVRGEQSWDESFFADWYRAPEDHATNNSYVWTYVSREDWLSS